MLFNILLCAVLSYASGLVFPTINSITEYVAVYAILFTCMTISGIKN